MKSIIVIVSFLLIFSSISGHVVLAKESISKNNQLIDDAVSGENFDWDKVDWSYIEEEYNNDEEIILEEDDLNDEYEYIDLDGGEEYLTEFDFEVINEEDQRFEEADDQPQIWGFIARVAVSGGKHIVKYGSKIFKKQSTSKAINHTKNFTPARINVGNGNTVVLQRSSMNHILQRHHPMYWTGAEDKILLNPNISSSTIRSQIISILNKNKSKINKNGYGTINVKINGQKYRLVVSNNRVTTFYPVR